MSSLDPSQLTDPSSNDEVLDSFLNYLIEEGIEPYENQEEAIFELFAGHNVILNAPTGGGRRAEDIARGRAERTGQG